MTSRVHKGTTILVALSALLALLVFWARPALLGLDPERGAGGPDALVGIDDALLGEGRAESVSEAPTLTGNDTRRPLARGPVEVDVLSPLGRPLPGVAVRLERDSRNGTGEMDWATTDAAGRVSFSDVIQDGRALVCVGVARLARPGSVRRLIATRGAVGWEAIEDKVTLLAGFAGSVPVDGPSLTYRLFEGVPLTLEAVRADDGAAAGVQALAFPCFVGPDTKPIAMGRLLAVRAGLSSQAEFLIPAPPGYVAFDHPPWRMAVPPRTSRILVRVPVRPEAQVRLVFPDDAPAGRHATFRPVVHVAGMETPAPTWVEFDAIGNARLRGVPFIVGGRVEVVGGFDEDVGLAAEGSVLLSETPDAEHVLRLTSCEDFITDHVETDNDLPFEESFGRMDAAADATLVVHVTDAAGRAVDGAVVWFHNEQGSAAEQTADAQGAARFEGLYPGSGRVTVWGAGAPTHREGVVLTGGETVELHVRGVPGGDLALTVTDAEGRPVSFARFFVVQPSELTWFDLDPAGVLRADRFVDADGTRTLHGLEPGPVKLRVWYGHRSAETTVVVRDGRRLELALQIR